jgi:hypothetical protein
MSAQAPDLIEPIVGWRVWRVARVSGRARLASLTRELSWPADDDLLAECNFLPSIRHPAPWPTCRCGIYAARTSAGIAEEVTRASRRDEYLALGRVALWGRVCEAEHGYRASVAAPTQLALLAPEHATSAERIDVAFGLADYRVPVTLVDQPRDAVVDELRHDVFDIDPFSAGLARSIRAS